MEAEIREMCPFDSGKSYSAMFTALDHLCNLLRPISFLWKKVLIYVVQEMISQSFLLIFSVKVQKS